MDTNSLFKPSPDTEQKLRNDRERALNALRVASLSYPQQRLGQLLSNSLHGSAWESDTFYAPDSDVAQALEGYAYGFKGTPERADATEIDRLRKALLAVKTLTETALHPAKVAPNGFTVLSKLNEIAATALKTPISG